MKRRQFLLGMGGLGLSAAGVAAWKYWPEQGFTNPCLSGLPPHLAKHDLVQAAWEGLDPAKVWDCHAHLVGAGDGGSGIQLNPGMDNLWNPLQYAQKRFFLNASCSDSPGRTDQAYVERMRKLIDDMRPGFKLLLLAFDRFHTEAGEVNWERTTFYTPDAYAQKMARSYPHYFEWAASIHPYRRDCVEALQEAVKNGARAVKWLPAAMGMDPASKSCDRFYQALTRYDIPLITHAGRELAVAGSTTQEYGNPLRLRRALDHGVRVVVAHCASLGEDRDFDRGPNGPVMESFELFARLMAEPRYEGKLFGDISAITQLNRAASVKAILERAEWHPRLLNGSDYPLPGVMPLFSVKLFAGLGLIAPAAVAVLKAIREYNPLLFDFVLKRSLRSGSKRFAAGVFETQPFFSRGQRALA